MKKRIIIIAGFAGLLIIAASCNKKLDLAPGNTVVEKDVFKTASGAEQALSEVYYNFLQAMTRNISYTYGDFTTPLLKLSTTFQQYSQGEATPTDYSVVNIWTSYFKAINSANNVIAKIPVYGTFDKQLQARFIAEAKFIRAYSFLTLLCLYGDGGLSNNKDGLGVPLQLTPFEGYDTKEIIPRATNDAVFSQIITDLTEAVPDLPDRFSDELKTRSRATQGAAWALMARTYLYQRDYKEAAAAAQHLLDASPAIYALSTNLLTLFPFNPNGTSQSFSSEIVFGLPVSHMVSSSQSLDNGIGSQYYYKRSYWINPDFVNEFEEGDLRLQQLIWHGDSVYNPARLNEHTTFKFNNRYGRDNVPLIRLAEVMLTKAECIARVSGVTEEAVRLLNQIRKRSVPTAVDYETSSFTSDESLLNAILLQRKFELAFEGLYRYDLIRTGKALKDPDIPENKKVLPIPQVEVDISHGLIKQNTGY